MTEVPEHLLKKAAEARARMSGETPPDDGAAADAPAAAAPATPTPVEAAPVAETPAAPEPVTPSVEAARRRNTIPVWVMPVLLFLPIWAIYYVGYLERPPEAAAGLAAEGGEIFSGTCASCHGGGGGGGAGRQLNSGEVLLTFPGDTAEYDGLAGHVAWVANGSAQTGTTEGEAYGASDRPGGQHTVGSFGANMGNFNEALTIEELVAVVHYERVAHGELSEEAAAEEAGVLEAFIQLREEAGDEHIALGESVAEISAQLEEARNAAASGGSEAG